MRELKPASCPDRGGPVQGKVGRQRILVAERKGSVGDTIITLDKRQLIDKKQNFNSLETLTFKRHSQRDLLQMPGLRKMVISIKSLKR